MSNNNESQYFYAELDENNVVKALIDTNVSPEEIADCFVQIPEYEESYLLKKYENGEWHDVERSETEYEPTETELIQAEILLNQAEILAKQNEQDEVLAEILLNQMGV